MLGSLQAHQAPATRQRASQRKSGPARLAGRNMAASLGLGESLTVSHLRARGRSNFRSRLAIRRQRKLYFRAASSVNRGPTPAACKPNSPMQPFPPVAKPLPARVFQNHQGLFGPAGSKFRAAAPPPQHPHTHPFTVQHHTHTKSTSFYVGVDRVKKPH